ncbi:hypothetical protein JCM11641_000767 [Rhodosporidiobolus odoratus]
MPRQQSATIEQALSTLVSLFPQHPPPFLLSCLVFTAKQPAALLQPVVWGDRQWSADAFVEAVSAKLLDEEGNRGELVGWVNVDAADRGGEAESRASLKGKGKGREVQRGGGISGRSLERVEDVTLSRNLALIRLHVLFPLVPISNIRRLLLGLEHSFLYLATEELLRQDRAGQEKKRRDNDWGGAGGRGGFIQVLRSIFSSSYDSPSAQAVSNTKPVPDPILKPDDLFHSPSYTSTLMHHFTLLFPSLELSYISRLIEQDGGTYASIRTNLEVEVAGQAAQSATGRAVSGSGSGKKKKWWAFLAPHSPSPPGFGSDSSTSSSSSLAEQLSREERAQRVLVEGSKGALREWEEWNARRRRRKPRSLLSPTLEADEQLERRERERVVECQCCFGEVRLAMGERGIVCSLSSSSLDSDVEGKQEQHYFCSSCLESYISTFTTGSSPLPAISLGTLILPCFASSSFSPSGICPRIIPCSTLSSALPHRMLKAFERRTAAANLETFSSSSDQESGLTLTRCSFCPYAALLPPSPSLYHPLSRIFAPAWVEAFPPSPLSIIHTVLASALLVLLTVIVSFFALLWPGRSSRLEHIYHDLYPSSSTLSRASQPQTREPISPLPLTAVLLLSPQQTFPFALSYLRIITQKVLRRKDGIGTVFRCRNDGIPRRGHEGSGGDGGGLLEKMLKVEEGMRTWVQEEPERDDEGSEGREDQIVERRREHLVELVWGLTGDTDNDRSTLKAEEEGVGVRRDEGAGEEEEEEEEEDDICGRLSCLLCSAQVNPSAPSLHRCSPSPSSSSLAKSEAEQEKEQKEKAEESLRLAVEKAMSAAGELRCGRCGVGVVKAGGCNKVTCRCSALYCWACRSPISSSEGYRHFCQHFRAEAGAPCTECSKCHLFQETDEESRVRDAASLARIKWARENPEWAEKVQVEGIRVGPPGWMREGDDRTPPSAPSLTL